MNKAEPIRDPEELKKFKNYFLEVKKHPRNYMMITMGLNTALRISDILDLTWKAVYDFSTMEWRTHLYLMEQKTDKTSQIYLNKNIQKAMKSYWDVLKKKEEVNPNDYMFRGDAEAHISRVQAYRIVRGVAKDCHISGVISPHSMRKTFGYHAWKKGVPPAMLMDIYQHSSYAITKRYLGIGQDERDDVFRDMEDL